MTLTIILFALVLLGFVMLCYGMNIMRNGDEAKRGLRSRKHIRQSH